MPFRRAEVDLELRLIVVGHEVLVRNHEQRHARQEHQHRHPRHDRAMGHRPFEYPRVEDVHRVEHPRVFSSRVSPSLVRSIFSQRRRQHRRQGEADQQRDHDRERHRQAEALHEPADDPAHEGDGDEDGDERQRGGEHGEADFLRRLDRRVELVVVLFLDEPVDVLEAPTIASSMTMPTESVSASIVIMFEREAHVPDQPEGRDDRRRDGDRGDDRSSAGS